jgi:hypothetical protein
MALHTEGWKGLLEGTGAAGVETVKGYGFFGDQGGHVLSWLRFSCGVLTSRSWKKLTPSLDPHVGGVLNPLPFRFPSASLPLPFRFAYPNMPSIVIIFNNSDIYTAISISNMDVKVAYDVPTSSQSPVYTNSKTFKNTADLLDYVDVLVKLVALDNKPSQYIDIQATLFPNIIVKAAEFQSMYASGLLIQAIKQSLSLTN